MRLARYPPAPLAWEMPSCSNSRSSSAQGRGSSRHESGGGEDARYGAAALAPSPSAPRARQGARSHAPPRADGPSPPPRRPLAPAPGARTGGDGCDGSAALPPPPPPCAVLPPAPPCAATGAAGPASNTASPPSSVSTASNDGAGGEEAHAPPRASACARVCGGDGGSSHAVGRNATSATPRTPARASATPARPRAAGNGSSRPLRRSQCASLVRRATLNAGCAAPTAALKRPATRAPTRQSRHRPQPHGSIQLKHAQPAAREERCHARAVGQRGAGGGGGGGCGGGGRGRLGGRRRGWRLHGRPHVDLPNQAQPVTEARKGAAINVHGPYDTWQVISCPHQHTVHSMARLAAV
jgi:hypothetical protein